jgi:hypothetical protein
MAMTDAAKREALSPQQAAKSIRRGDKSWLMLEQKEEADGLGVFAAGPSNELPKSTPGLLSQERIGKVIQDFKGVFEPISECQPHRFDVDHTIKLVEESTPTFRRPFRLSRQEEEEGGGRCFEKRTHRAECVTVWCPGFICAEKRWVLAHVH